MDEFAVHGNLMASSRRIISLAPSVTEMLFYLGLGDAVVGVTRQCDYPGAASDRGVIGSFLMPDKGLIEERSPDTIIGLSCLHHHLVEFVRDKPVALLLLDYRSVAGILDVMEAVASLAVVAKTAAKRVAVLRRRVNRLQSEIAGCEPVRTLFLISESPIMIPARHSYQYDALRLAGAAQLSGSYTQYERVTLEEVADFNPEIILACGAHRGQPLPKMCPDCRSPQPVCQRIVEDIGLKSHWQATSAAITGNIVAAPCHWLCRPGPRLVDGLEEIAAAIDRTRGGRA